MEERWGIFIMAGIWIKSGGLSIVKSSCGRDLVPQQHPDHNCDGQQRVASSRSVGV